PEEPAARRIVDELRAQPGQLRELGAHVVYLVRDVVHAGTALREELADRRVLAERGQELDASRADAQRRRLDALVGDGRAMLDLGAEEPLVRRDGLVEIGDRDPEVVDSLRGHGPGC